MNDHGKKVFKEAVQDGKDWAVKKLLDKLFADKKATEIPGKDGEPIKFGLDDDTLKLVEEFIKFRKTKI